MTTGLDPLHSDLSSSTSDPSPHVSVIIPTYNRAQYLLQAVDSGVIEPVVDSVFALDDTVDAFRRLQAAEQFGKVAVELP